MATSPPAWALRIATESDHFWAKHSKNRNGLVVEWPDLDSLKDWATERGWKCPQRTFKECFLDRMVKSSDDFALAVRESGIRIRVPVRNYAIPAKRIAKLDQMYQEREDMGILGKRPTRWGALVDELREIRHAIEAGATLVVDDGKTILDDFSSFYTWAHGRYHGLEDGHDDWIGMD